MSLPFQQTKTGVDTFAREFLGSVEDHELHWHWDDKNRWFVCEHDTDWQFQMEDQLPAVIERGKTYYIPKKIFHRIIKGEGNLTLQIKEED